MSALPVAGETVTVVKEAPYLPEVYTLRIDEVMPTSYDGLGGEVTRIHATVLHRGKSTHVNVCRQNDPREGFRGETQRVDLWAKTADRVTYHPGPRPSMLKGGIELFNGSEPFGRPWDETLYFVLEEYIRYS